MPHLCCPRCLPCDTSHEPCPPCVSPEMDIGLVAAPVAPISEQLPGGAPDQIPAIPKDLDKPTTVCSSSTPTQADEAYHSDGGGSSSGSDEEEGGDEAGRPELPPDFINATVHGSGEIAIILDKMSSDFGGIFLDIHSSDESTIHPANGILIQSLEIFCGNTVRVQSLFCGNTADCTIEPYSVMFDCWVSKLEEDAELICQGEKGRMYIFLLNNTYDAWQMMRCPGASFSNVELTNRLISMIQRYKKSYFDECWVPLNNPCRLDMFTSDFLIICDRQMIWKVTAELKYKMRQEIVELILPPYGASLLAREANRSQLSKILYWTKRVIAGKKKQKKYTVDVLEKVIRELFEG